MNSKIKKILIGVEAALVGLFALELGFKWTVERVYVGPTEMAMVIQKFGKPLPPDAVVAPRGDSGYKGVQEEMLGPGRYFLNPVFYEVKKFDLNVIPAGEPQRWEWDVDGKLKDPSTAPMVGLVARKDGAAPPPGVEIVDAGFKGLQKEVLTPGVYKLNPQQYDVKLEPAKIVPPGFVGVVTRLTGELSDKIEAQMQPLTAVPATRAVAATQLISPEQAAAASTQPQPIRLVSGPSQRGILKDVLPPGIYYLNPRMVDVRIVGVGYDAITLDARGGSAIRFYTSDGYQVEADFTVVWGREPKDAPYIVANIGGTSQVEHNVIDPAMKAACQNEGAKCSAKELIQGTTRRAFQNALSKALEDQVQGRNIHILLALIRNISIKDKSGNDATGNLLGTIQQTNIEKERLTTNDQKTKTAEVKAQLDSETKLVDIARETVSSDTNVQVAQILAKGARDAAQITAQQQVKVAELQYEVAKYDAQRQQIMGAAQAEVLRLKNEAEAKGAKLLIDAFGSPQSYNLYIFAKNFEPRELKLFFAGPGTFWTDLKSFQDVGMGRVLDLQNQQSQPGPAGK